ncbi:MAG: cytochrome c family protein [Steroidobacteraceae bacterium]
MKLRSGIDLYRLSRGAIAALALCGQAHAANPSHGEEIFKITCAACHVAERDASRADLATRVGPNLWGVIGRKAGIYKGYAYSYAMRTSGIIWTDQQLGRYIAAPQKTVPNVRMNFMGLKNPNDIQDVIAYLHTFR